MRKFVIGFLCALGVSAVFLISPASANNVALSNAVLKNPAGGKITVEFKLSQENPFGNVTFDSIAFSDYIWVFVKFSTTNGSDGSWKHATLSAGGGVAPTADNLGAFIKSSLAGPAGATFNVLWNYTADGVGAIDANTLVKICSIEMVEIPTGSFYFNAGGIGITTGADDGTKCYDGTGVDDGANEVLIDAANKNVPIDPNWPNGYNAFYLAKYEISQQQFVDFLNTITATDAANSYDATKFNTNGYRIQFNAGAPYGARYTTDAPNRACNFLDWDNDTKRYLSWAALRPMTEMEFEKAARGTQKAGTNKRTYPWGNTAPSTNTGSVDGGTHIIHYANYNNTAGAKPILVGWYLSQGYAPSATEATGASPYGIADLAGNVWEHLINCDWTTVPTNGNGTITPPASWPGAATGKGLRGGYWGSTATNLQVSYRYVAGWTGAGRDNVVGFRPARTK